MGRRLLRGSSPTDAEASSDRSAIVRLPLVERSHGIPRLIHQTFHSLAQMPEELKANIAHIKALNPDYEHRLYDDSAIASYIKTHYVREIQLAYEEIHPTYGAARADLFRYLVMYKEGGVYLDIKSTTMVPLERCIHPADQYILSQWDNGAGKPHDGWGLSYEALPGGEYQQWHIIAARGHPYLKAVIARVLANIRSYRPWRDGVGKFGVFSTTGPWAYTNAILPIRDLHPRRIVSSEASVGLRYSIYDGPQEHQKLSKSYYRWSTANVIRPGGPMAVIFDLYRLKRGLQRRIERLSRPLKPSS